MQLFGILGQQYLGGGDMSHCSCFDALLNPGIRDDIVGLWMATAGRTGLRLYDLSGYENHATFSGANKLTWGNSQWGDVIVGTNDGDQGLVLDRMITFPAGQPCTMWLYWYRVAGDSQWASQDANTSVITRIGAAVYTKTTTVLESLNSDPGSGAWQSWTTTRDDGDNIEYRIGGGGDPHGVEAGTTGIYNVQNLMNYPGADLAISGEFLGMALWKRKLTRGELHSLAADPNYMLRRKTDWSIQPCAAGGTSLPRSFAGPFGGVI